MSLMGNKARSGMRTDSLKTFIVAITVFSVVILFAFNIIATSKRQHPAVKRQVIEEKKPMVLQLLQEMNSKLNKLVEAIPKTCHEIIEKMMANKKSVLSGPDVFGLNASCLRGLTGLTLQPHSVTNVDYGEESLLPFNTTHCHKRTMTESEKRLHFNKRITEFVQLLENGGFGPFFLDGGTLVGSLRHLGSIPWDDDVDIIVDLKHREKLAKYLQKIEKEGNSERWKFSFTGQADKHMKFRVPSPYFANSEDRQFQFCFDMFFYEIVNKTTINIKGLGGGDNFYPTEVIFPTALRPYEDGWLPVPRRSVKFLEIRYGGAWGTSPKHGGFDINGTCTFSSWSNPKSASSCEIKDVKCRSLAHAYAFIHRMPLTKDHLGPCLEFLVFQKTVLKAAFMFEPGL